MSRTEALRHMRDMRLEIGVVVLVAALVAWIRKDAGFINDDWEFLFRDGRAFDGYFEPHTGHLVAGTIAAMKGLHALVGFHYVTFAVVLQVSTFLLSRLLLAFVLRAHGLGHAGTVAAIVLSSFFGAEGQHRLVFLGQYVSLSVLLVLGWVLLVRSSNDGSRTALWVLSIGLVTAVLVHGQVIVAVGAFIVVASARRLWMLALAGLPAVLVYVVWLIAYGRKVRDRSDRVLSDASEWPDMVRDAVDIAVSYVAQLTQTSPVISAVLVVAFGMASLFLARRRPPSPLEWMLLITLAVGAGQRAYAIADLESGSEALDARHYKNPLSEIIIVVALFAARLSRALDPRLRPAALLGMPVAALLLIVNIDEYRRHVDSREDLARQQRDSVEIAWTMLDEPTIDRFADIDRQLDMDRVGRLEQMGWNFTKPEATGEELAERTRRIRGVLRFSTSSSSTRRESRGTFRDPSNGELFGTDCRPLGERSVELSTDTGGSVSLQLPEGSRVRISGDDRWGDSFFRSIEVGEDDEWLQVDMVEVPGGLAVRLTPSARDADSVICH